MTLTLNCGFASTIQMSAPKGLGLAYLFQLPLPGGHSLTHIKHWLNKYMKGGRKEGTYFIALRKPDQPNLYLLSGEKPKAM